MFQRYAAGLMVMPVLLAAWLTFRAEPVIGLPLNQIVVYEFPDGAAEVSEPETTATDERGVSHDA